MKSLCFLLPVPAVSLCLLPLLLASPAPVANTSPSQDEVEPTPAEARALIDVMYDAWGRARVELDKETMESILAPEFYVLLNGQKISREKFLSDVSNERKGTRLTRFDADILTVQRTENGWTVVITERLEIAVTGSGGETQKVYSFWVTRDGCRREGDKWLVTSSEAIGWEYWKPGTKPPFTDW